MEVEKFHGCSDEEETMTMANTATIWWGKYNIDIKDNGTAMVECNSLKMETTQDCK